MNELKEVISFFGRIKKVSGSNLHMNVMVRRKELQVRAKVGTGGAESSRVNSRTKSCDK